MKKYILAIDEGTAAFCEELKLKGYGDYIRDTTGLLIDAYFSASKIRWILDNVEVPVTKYSMTSADSR